MIRVENLSFEVPVKELYRKISFEIKSGDHCVLIGSNGVGKSTLANMICYPEEYLYDGKIVKENCSTSYEDAAPQNDLMERLLRAREERK